jgi:hypothetical protein
MKKFFGSRTTILTLGFLSVLAFLFLIASLGSLEFKPGVPFFVRQPPVSAPPAVPPSWNTLIYLVILFIAIVVAIFILLPPQQKKRFLITIGVVAVVGVLIFFILSQLGTGTQVTLPEENGGGAAVTVPAGPTETPAPEITPAVFTPPTVSSLSSFLIALFVILVFGLLIGWQVWMRSRKDTPYEALADIARVALDDFEAGKDWGDIILNSYQQMNMIVTDWRGIHRRSSSTPAEFSDFLVSAHLPREAVSRLTNLFERVRYGNKTSTPQDIQDAVESLTTILDYCQANK